MKPRLNTKLTIVEAMICTRPISGFFITRTFLKKTCFQLTKLNKPPLINYKSISCKGVILPVVKLGICQINKFGHFLISNCGITTLYCIPSSTSTFLNYLCASGVKPDFCICSFRAWLVQKLGALYNPLLIFEFCFFT